MDAARFDEIVRTLFESVSRRALFGFGAAGALAVFGLQPDETFAKKQKRRKKRKICQKCNKRGKCKPKRDGTACGETCHACQNGRCVVAAGAGCGSSHRCLPNAACAQTCVTGADCPPGCVCTGPNQEGMAVCLDSTDPAFACVGPFQECSTSADCPPNETCFETACGGGLKICIALCPV